MRVRLSVYRCAIPAIYSAFFTFASHNLLKRTIYSPYNTVHASHMLTFIPTYMHTTCIMNFAGKGVHIISCLFQRMENSQRAQLMQGTSSLQRASDSIARSQLVAAETDMIGNEIVEELGTQRESLLRTRDRVSSVAISIIHEALLITCFIIKQILI